MSAKKKSRYFRYSGCVGKGKSREPNRTVAAGSELEIVSAEIEPSRVSLPCQVGETGSGYPSFSRSDARLASKASRGA